jgi:tetratricopeptide (TPR) repeat protein
MTSKTVWSAVVLALCVPAGALPARAGADEALANFKAGRYLEAVGEIQVVLDQSPGYAYGHFLLGHCLLKMNRVGDAEHEFRRALNIDPGRAEYYQGFALALNASGNWPFTVRAATEGLTRASDPRTRYALYALRSYAWAALRRWSDAVSDLESAQRIRTDPWLLVFLGKARFAMGNYTDAIPPLRQSLQVTPDDQAVLRLLAECHIRLAAGESDPVQKRFDYGQSLDYAQRFASVRPGDLDAIQLVGRAALGAGRLDQAVNIFRHVLANDPRQCYALADLGRTYMAAARWAEAEAYLRKAVACAPRLKGAYESLGEVYLQLGRPQEAAIAYRRADETAPTRPASDLPATVPVFAPR